MDFTRFSRCKLQRWRVPLFIFLCMILFYIFEHSLLASCLPNALVTTSLYQSTFTAPFTCPLSSLPSRARMLRRHTPDTEYVLLGHGFKDIVTDANWDADGIGGWEDDLANTMERYLKAVIAIEPSRSVFMDLGANIGTHTLYFAARGYETHAFEPTYANYVLLKCALAFSDIRSAVRLNTFGLGDKVQNVCMDSVSWNFGDTRVDLQNENCEAHQQARMDTLDTYYGKYLRGRKQALLKIDIQGFEIPALRHGTQLFDSEDAPVVVFLEYEPIRIRAQGYEPLELIEYFRERDYEMWKFVNGTRWRNEDLDAFGNGIGYFDVVAVKGSWKKRAESAGYRFAGGRLE